MRAQDIFGFVSFVLFFVTIVIVGCQSLVTSKTRSRSRAWSGSSNVRSFTADALK